jgi:uncharacterized protein (TIGR03663 family)
LLNRELFNNRTTLLYVAVGVILFSLQIYLAQTQIDLRPLHNDEGVNWHFITEILEKRIYPYSHENYHGPLFFYILTLSLYLFGDSIFAIRLPTLVFAALLPFLLLRLNTTDKVNNKLQNPIKFLFSYFAFFISASTFFYSRYAIHELLLVIGTVIFAIEVFLCTRNQLNRFILGLSLFILIATKETWIVNVASVGLSFLAVLLFERKDILAYLRNGWKNILPYSLTIGGLLSLLTFSALGTWSKGIREMVLAIPQWFGRGTEGDVGHFKRFAYYAVDVLWVAERPLCIAFIGMALLLAVPFIKQGLIKRSPWAIFTFVWTLTTFIFYSFIPYKTPWLVMNIVVPALIFIIEQLMQLWNWKKSSALIVAAIFFCSQFFYLKEYNFLKPYGPGNPFSYVQTSEGMLTVVHRIEALKKRYPAARILIAVPAYWPFPYYLRNLEPQPGYTTTYDIGLLSQQYDICVLEKGTIWNDPAFEHLSLRLSDVQEAEFYYRVEENKVEKNIEENK